MVNINLECSSVTVINPFIRNYNILYPNASFVTVQRMRDSAKKANQTKLHPDSELGTTTYNGKGKGR